MYINRTSRKIWKLLLFACIALMVFGGTAEAKKTKKKPKAETVSLTVNSKPEGATVAVDRVIRGVTPITITLEKGKHLVRISVDENWRPFIHSPNLTEDTMIDANLSPANKYSYALGRKAFEEEDFDKAKTHFKESLSPGGKIEPASYFYLALIDRKEKDYDSMAKKLKKYIDLNPPRGELTAEYPKIHTEPQNYGVVTAWYMLGEYYRKNYKWQDAATAFKLSIPDRDRFVDRTMEASWDNVRKFRDVVNSNPEDYKARLQLAYLFEMKGKLFQAMMAYREGARSLFSLSTPYIEKYGDYLEPLK